MDYTQEILNAFGTIKRARGCYLYTEKGVRITDMYQEEGRAILGWKHGNAMQFFKNTFDRGVLGNFFTDYSRQFEKAVKALFPFANEVRLFTTTRLPTDVSSLPLWKPWAKKDVSVDADAFVFYPPFPWTGAVVAVYKSTYNQASFGAIPDSDDVPSPLLAAISRGIYDLISELPERTETDFAKFDKFIKPYFNRVGPYLLPKISESEYDLFFQKTLKNGILISPNYKTPSIIPYGANLGDLKRL